MAGHNYVTLSLDCNYLLFAEILTFGGRTGDSLISLDETLQKNEGPISLAIPVIFYLKEEMSLYVRELNRSKVN